MKNISTCPTNISTQAMKLLYLPRSPCSLLVLLLFFSCSPFSLAADSAPALAVRQDGAFLYSRQDEYSDKIVTLQMGEALTPLAEAVGKETWYFVQTKQGLSGWVRAADVSLSEQLKQAFKEEPQGSIWRARASNGRTFEGTWTVEPGASPDKASGAWTLREGPAKTVARGVWTAQKFSTGWSGTWRASVEGQKTEHSGSWTADFPQAREPRFAELFEAAAREAIRGVWSSGTNSGSWSIRAGK